MSSFYEDASLVMIPSGYKTSKVYCAKPTDGAGDLTFTRSNDTATRVNSAGLIEKVRTNLILQSEAFNVTWTPVRSSVTANTTTAPDGTSTADTLFDSVDNNIHYVRQSFTAITGPATISIYAKANQLSQIQLVAAGGTTPMGRGFDLSTGTTFVESIGGVSSNDLGQSITAVGNGWYRCTMSWTSTGQNDFWILTSSANAATYAGTGTNGVFIWGAMLETGDIATDYIVTTTAAVSVGPVANVPRLDYLNSSCPRLLLEPQRINLTWFSENFDNAYHTKNQASITANNAVSPDGYTNADKLIPNTTNTDDHRLSGGTLTVTSGAAYTTSVFAKNGGYNVCSVRAANGGTVQVNLTTGAKTEYGSVTSSSVVDYGNGWYRISVTANASSTSYSPAILVQNSTASQYPVWAGNGTDGILLYGFMTEAGVYATSYIPTLGAAVTRGADVVQKTAISSLIGQTEGVVFLDYTVTQATNSNSEFSISSGSNSNAIRLRQSSGNFLQGVVQNGGVTQASIITTSSISVGQRYKIAFAYANNDFAMYVNGELIGIDGSGSVPACSQIQNTNGGASSTADLAGALNQVLLFKTRLSNSDLAALTTL